MELETRRLNYLLRYARQERGWSQARLGREIGTGEDVISRWERGERNPSPFFQEKLCLLFGKNARELGFLKQALAGGHPVTVHPVAKTGIETAPIVAHLEPFTFGTIVTTWIVVDGDGVHQYYRPNIGSHLDPRSESLPPELELRKKDIEQKQLHNREQGRAFHWNGQRYSLNRFVLSREGPEEDLALDLWFTPSDYFTFLATNMSLDDEKLRQKYLHDVDWSQPVPFFSNSFGVYLLGLTSDNFVLFTHRGRDLGSRPGEYNVSVCEGLSIVDTIQEPDVYHCAERGIVEELGLQAPEGFLSNRIDILSFGVDIGYSQWGLLGMFRSYKTAKEIQHYRRSGLKDRLENANLYAIPFQLSEIIPFVFDRAPWAPGGLACLYHALVHEFGRDQVELSINREVERRGLL